MPTMNTQKLQLDPEPGTSQVEQVSPLKIGELEDTGSTDDTTTLSKLDKAFLKKAGKALRDTKKAKNGAKTRKVENILRKALKHFHKAEYREGLQYTLHATELEPDNALGYHLMAVSLDKLGEKHKALLMFEKTLELDPDQFEVYLNLGSVARDLEMPDVAEKFFRIFLDLKPDLPEGYNDLAALLRDQNRFDDAIDILRFGINLMPEQPLLWNTMGTIAIDTTQEDDAITFFEEALRLDPNFQRARYNLGNLHLAHGKADEALAMYDKFLETSLPGHADTIEVIHARSLLFLHLGRLKEGWREYQIRNSPRFRSSQLYSVSAPMWDGEDIRGKNILVIGEQGVGDEIMFANPIRDLIDKVGEDGNVLISVTSRLVRLFERAYPEAYVASPVFTSHNGKTVHVTPWETVRGDLDFYTPMGDLSIFLRPDAASYRNVGRTIAPDPVEVDRWKDCLAEISDGPFVGVCWRSGMMTGGRGKHFASLDEWGSLFQHPGVTFVNLQYGDVSDELEEFKSRFGVTIQQMPKLDIKNDLDSNAALCAALDVVISAPTAAAAIAGAVGTKTWFVITGRGWPSLGEQDYPFYPDTEVFQQDVFGEWDSTFANLSTALDKLTNNR